MLYGNRLMMSFMFGGDELYATIDVERKGLLVKLSFYWNQEKLNQNMGG